MYNELSMSHCADAFKCDTQAFLPWFRVNSEEIERNVFQV